MKKKNLSARFIGRFSSIQSVIFATVAVLVLSAVVIVTGVSMRFTNTSIFENSSQYTQTIIQQMNQNIDSYIDYMENIAYLISSNEDVQDYLFSDEIDSEGRYRILKQFETILDSRSDIRNVGIISKSGRMLINNGSKSVNHDLNINTQEWYKQLLKVRKNHACIVEGEPMELAARDEEETIVLTRKNGEETLALIFNCSSSARMFNEYAQKYDLLRENPFDGKIEGLDAAVIVL